MKPKALFLITSDPRHSPRPAEAIRIAAGVAAWRQVEITLYLHEAAARALVESADRLGEEENFAHYLPLLARSGQPILLQQHLPEAWRPLETDLRFECIDEHQLARLALDSDYVVRF